MGNLYFLGAFNRKIENNKPVNVPTSHSNIIDIKKILLKSKIMPKGKLQEVLLYAIILENFKHSELTMWKRYIKRFHLTEKIWKPNETVLFVSNSGKLAYLFKAETKINNSTVLHTEKWRITGGSENWWKTDRLLYFAGLNGYYFITPSKMTVNEAMAAFK